MHFFKKKDCYYSLRHLVRNFSYQSCADPEIFIRGAHVQQIQVLTTFLCFFNSTYYTEGVQLLLEGVVVRTSIHKETCSHLLIFRGGGGLVQHVFSFVVDYAFSMIANDRQLSTRLLWNWILVVQQSKAYFS